MMDEAYISIPGIPGTGSVNQAGIRAGWNKLLLEGNQVITKMSPGVVSLSLTGIFFSKRSFGHNL